MELDGVVRLKDLSISYLTCTQTISHLYISRHSRLQYFFLSILAGAKRHKCIKQPLFAQLVTYRLEDSEWWDVFSHYDCILQDTTKIPSWDTPPSHTVLKWFPHIPSRILLIQYYTGYSCQVDEIESKSSGIVGLNCMHTQMTEALDWKKELKTTMHKVTCTYFFEAIALYSSRTHDFVDFGFPLQWVIQHVEFPSSLRYKQPACRSQDKKCPSWRETE